MTEAGYATNPVTTQKQVYSALDNLNKNQEHTSNVIERLEQALQGVLRASDPSNSPQGTQQANEVPLATLINGASDWQRRTAQRLESILERLEV